MHEPFAIRTLRTGGSLVPISTRLDLDIRRLATRAAQGLMDPQRPGF